MGKTRTSAEVHMRYREKAYESINFDVPKGRKAELAVHLKAKGITVSAFLNQCMREELGIPSEEWKTYRPQKAEKAPPFEKRKNPGKKTPGQTNVEEKKERKQRKETWLMRD